MSVLWKHKADWWWYSFAKLWHQIEWGGTPHLLEAPCTVAWMFLHHSPEAISSITTLIIITICKSTQCNQGFGGFIHTIWVWVKEPAWCFMAAAIWTLCSIKRNGAAFACKEKALLPWPSQYLKYHGTPTLLYVLSSQLKTLHHL